MKIIAEVEDTFFLQKNCVQSFISKAKWMWGLGDDKEIYFKGEIVWHSKIYDEIPDWRLLGGTGYLDKSVVLSFSDFKKLVELFKPYLKQEAFW